jgi:hypothetical protein
MARVPSLRWKIPESVLCRDPGVYAGGLAEGTGLEDQMNRPEDSGGMQSR